MATHIEIDTKGVEALTKRAAWKALEAHYKKAQSLHLRELFAE